MLCTSLSECFQVKFFVMLTSLKIVCPESAISSPITQIQQLYLCQWCFVDLFYLLILVSCWWWGIHHYPPSTSLFLSTSTHHPRVRQRNHSVPWNLHASIVGILIYNGWFTSLTSDRNIPQIFDFNSFFHISLECTTVPWEPSSLLVISLAFVNSIYQWPVIKQFITCSTSTSFFTLLQLYYLVLRWIPWVAHLPPQVVIGIIRVLYWFQYGGHAGTLTVT